MKVRNKKVFTIALFISISLLFIAAKKNVEHVIDQSICTQCGDCIKACEQNAIIVSSKDGKKIHTIDPTLCTQCGDCIDACKEDAIQVMKKKK